MANVKFPRKEFEKQVGQINEKMKEKIALFGTPLENLNKEEVELEIFPDRPDLLSFQGYLRSFKSFLGKGKERKYKIKKARKNYKVEIDKSVKHVRPFTACCIVKNLKFDNEKIKEIIDVQEKIHSTLGRNRRKVAIGIYPLENIKLPIKYEARKPKNIKFQPLESKREMNGRQILSRHKTGREYSHLLKDKEKFPVFVDSNNQILSMPPIINSEKTGKISEKTKHVFIECSGFDFEILKKTLNILVTTLAEMDGKVYKMNLRYYKNSQTKKNEKTPDLSREKIKIDVENINKLLGLNLTNKKIDKLLKKMGYSYNQNKKQVKIPPWRTDILHEVDIAEDIAIAYGYDNFKPEIPEVATIGKESKESKAKRKIAEILTGLNLTETSSYHLLSKNDLKRLRSKRKKIEVENSKTEYKILRPSLLPSILKTLSENIDKEYPQKIFEIGTCFSPDEKQETRLKEKDKLAIALTPSNFTELKQKLNYLFEMLNLKNEIKEKQVNELEFIQGRTASILLKNKEIGYFGETHPSLLNSWNLKMPLAYLEINLQHIYEKLK